MRDSKTGREIEAERSSSHESFVLSDGHTYMEHAGMSIEQELYRNLCSDWPEAS